MCNSEFYNFKIAIFALLLNLIFFAIVCCISACFSCLADALVTFFLLSLSSSR